MKHKISIPMLSGKILFTLLLSLFFLPFISCNKDDDPDPDPIPEETIPAVEKSTCSEAGKEFCVEYTTEDLPDLADYYNQTSTRSIFNGRWNTVPLAPEDENSALCQEAKAAAESYDPDIDFSCGSPFLIISIEDTLGNFEPINKAKNFTDGASRIVLSVPEGNYDINVRVYLDTRCSIPSYEGTVNDVAVISGQPTLVQIDLLQESVFCAAANGELIISTYVTVPKIIESPFPLTLDENTTSTDISIVVDNELREGHITADKLVFDGLIGSTAEVPGEVSGSGAGPYSFTVDNLQNGYEYTLKFLSLFVERDNGSLDNFTGTITVGGSPDTQAPSITASSPSSAEDLTVHTTSTQGSITFSEPVKGVELENTISIDNKATLSNLSGSGSGPYTFDIENLRNGKSYNLTISNGITDLPPYDQNAFPGQTISFSVGEVATASGGPSGSGNPMVTIPDTATPASASSFELGGTGCNDSSCTTGVKASITGFDINKYEISNEEFQENFFDLDGDGNLSELGSGCSAYFEPECIGPGGINAITAWEEAMDLDNDGSSDRPVIISSSGVQLGQTQNDKDVSSTSQFSMIQGPGVSLSNGSQTTYWGANATPWQGATYSDYSDAPAKPVIYVSWYEARAYCKFVYGPFADLPTEAQWERAAKGETSSNYQYPWGSSPSASCSTMHGFGCTPSATKPVGNIDAGKTAWDSSVQLLDMSGNVSEWNLTWSLQDGGGWTAYDQSSGWNSGLDPAKYMKGSVSKRSVRGGSWNDLNSYGATAHHDKITPTSRLNRVGFRCVRP